MAPKVANFMWRALSNALPSLWSLFRRKIVKTPIYAICGDQPKTIEHCLLHCPWTLAVWVGCSLGYTPDREKISHLEECWRSIRMLLCFRVKKRMFLILSVCTCGRFGNTQVFGGHEKWLPKSQSFHWKHQERFIKLGRSKSVCVAVFSVNFKSFYSVDSTSC
ncbi:hypothetical protein ACLB2K_009780 [Fragaria x ananassa]